MSASEWRYADEQGVERVMATAQLRAALANGKVPPSTLVWREGMKEPAPAFTIAELSSAAIAARRSAFPPRPKPTSSATNPVTAKASGPSSSRDSVRPGLRPPTVPPGARPPAPRAPMRTLVGLEPEAMMGSLGLGPKPEEASEAQDATAPAIPPAPRLPLDTETTSVDATETPHAPVAEAAPLPQGRHKTLLGGLAPRPAESAASADASRSVRETQRSQPPPPPRRRAAVVSRPPNAEATSAETSASTSTRPRQRSVPPPPPRRRPGAPGTKTDDIPAASGLSASAQAGDGREKGPDGRRLTTLEIEKTEAISPAGGEATGGGEQSRAKESAGAGDDGAASSLRGLTKTLEMETGRRSTAHASLTDDDDDAPTRQFDKDVLEGQRGSEAEASPSTPPPDSGARPTQARERDSSMPPGARSAADADGEDSDAASVLAARRAAVRRDAVEVPLTSLVAASAVWIVGLVAFFFAGRMTGHQSAPRLAPAKSGVGTSYLVYGATRPATPQSTELKPCWVTRQPTRWLPSASRSIPFDMRAGSDSMELGLAVDEHEALGLVIDPRSGKFEEKLRKRSDKEVVRVMPMGQNEGFLVSEEGGRTILPVGTSPRLFVVLGKDAIGASDSVDGEPSTIWPLEGDDTTTAESVIQAGSQFHFVMRRGRDVRAGWFGADKLAATPLGTVAGSGGRGGKPKSGYNGKEVAITFADKPDDDTPWQVRLARAPVGAVPEASEVVKLPEGGPGGDSIAPDIVGFDDGRWLLMWTEGEAGQRAIRAQTFGPGLEPIGDPIALSPPAGNFGQAVLGSVGGYTTVVFLQRGDADYELWGAVLQCGS